MWATDVHNVLVGLHFKRLHLKVMEAGKGPFEVNLRLYHVARQNVCGPVLPAEASAAIEICEVFQRVDVPVACPTLRCQALG